MSPPSQHRISRCSIGDSRNGPAYYMINCAHPSHCAGVLEGGGDWIGRIRASRPNASAKSHEELEAAQELDAGDPIDLGRRCGDLARRLPQLNVFGGCCGTDIRHIEAIARSAELRN